MYFFTIVQALVDAGYTRGDDVRGAPYDWRKAPSKHWFHWGVGGVGGSEDPSASVRFLSFSVFESQMRTKSTSCGCSV